MLILIFLLEKQLAVTIQDFLTFINVFILIFMNTNLGLYKNKNYISEFRLHYDNIIRQKDIDSLNGYTLLQITDEHKIY